MTWRIHAPVTSYAALNRGYQPRLIEVREIERHYFAVDVDLDLSSARLPQHPHEVPLPFDRHTQLDASLVAGEADEILFFPQQPIEPRRGNLEAVVIDILHRKNAAQMAAHLGAILDVDAAG